MKLKRTEVDFAEIANLLMYSNKKLVVVSEEPVTKNHTFDEVVQMHLQGGKFFLVEEDWSDLPEIEDYDPYDGPAEDPECGLPFVKPDESEAEEEKVGASCPVKENGCTGSVDALDRIVNGKNATVSSVPKMSDQLKAAQIEEDEDPSARESEEPKKEKSTKGRTSRKKISAIYHMCESGASVSEISSATSLSEKSVLRWINRFENGDIDIDDYEEEGS